jgi:hypothetical protein
MFFTLKPKLVIALIALAYGCGWAHLRADLLALRIVKAAIVAIETDDQISLKDMV